ncbi:hypothetical protein BLS_006482 [Venturia inaequalis]|uniref:Uncharacterized protein n=1 Tax=Venturia inaequalis TaxID=5025 RepID=A0A8H3Z785_VENIN|nr:hypothetical protein BLS_006482 [Venturia inaequalis]
MPRLFSDELYARTLAAEGHLEASRRSRAPLREAQLFQSLEAREQSASSSEYRSSSSRRNSLFSKRPKSAMTTRSSEAGHDESRRPSTTMEMPIMPSAEPESSRSRFLFGRGRKSSKSSGSKIRANSPTDIYDDGYVSRNRESKHRRETSGGSRGSSKDFFAEFRALRRGHRAAVIGPSRGAQVEERKTELARPQRGPAPLRPKRSDERLMPEQVPAPEVFGMQPLRHIRSAEQFSLENPSTQTAGPPKRPLHRPPPLNPALFPPTANYNLPHLDNGSINDEWDHLLPLYENRSPPLNQVDNQTGPMRSIALPDNVQDHIKSPIFNLPLEQVPEEPEGTLSSRQSKDISYHTSTIRHAKSSPMLFRNGSRTSFRKRSQMPPAQKSMERPNSQGSDTLGDPTKLSNHSPVPMDGMVEEFSIKDRTLSWEDDIDYCYEHAAEANCDFDWNNLSAYDESDHDDLYNDDGPYTYARMQKDISKNKTYSMESTVSSSEGDSYRLPNRVYKIPSKDTLPELEYRSSHSTSTNSVSLLTPLDKFSFPSTESCVPQRLSDKDTVPSQLLYVERTESQMHQLYDQLLAKAEGAPPTVPPRSESRIEKTPPHEQTRQYAAASLLPTPPPSADQSPVIPDEEPARPDLHINTIVAALRRPLDSPVSPEYPPPPPPKSPPFQFRARSSTLGALRPNIFDAHHPPEEWPLTIPRSTSETSVVTAIPISHSPSPPSGSPPTSKLPTPPGFVTMEAPSSVTSAPFPAHGNAYVVPPRSTSRSASLSHPEPERPRQMHRKGSSDPISSKSTTPPLTPTFRPQTGPRPSRSSYSLFPPPPKSPGVSNLKSVKSMNFPEALRSAPVYGSFPPKPFSSRFDQFKHGASAPPRNAGFKARQRAFQIMP